MSKKQGKQKVKFDIAYNIHDKVFRQYLEHKEIAKDIIANYLPSKITKQMDFRTLKITKDSYVDKELKEHFSDMVYTISIADKKTFVYLLFEHKSYTDAMVPYQLLRNMVKIWGNYLKQNPNTKKFPVVLPLMFYHGKKRWTLGNKFSTIIEDVTGTEEYIPDFSFQLFDISHLDDKKIIGALETQMLFLTLKYIFSPKLTEKLNDIFALYNKISKKSTSTEYLEILLRYLTGAMKTDDKKILKKRLIESIKKDENIMPTIAEEWVKEGEVKGEIKGRVEGRVEGKLETIGNMLAEEFSWDLITKLTGITEKEYWNWVKKNR